MSAAAAAADAPPVGVVLFDAGNDIVAGDRAFMALDSGWASIAGAQAVRITSVHDLDSAVMWLVHLTDTQFFAARLNAHANFRGEGYLRTGLRHIYAELGVDPQQTSADVSASVLARVASRVVASAVRRHGVTLRAKALNEDVAAALRVPRSQLPVPLYPMFEGVAQHTYANTVQATTVRGQRRPSLTVRVNRLSHARYLLSQPLPPDTGWEIIARGRLSPSKREMQARLENTTTPFLVQCNVRNVAPEVAEVFSVGGGARHLREWLTDVEWRAALQWAEIDYGSLLLCESAGKPPEQASSLPADAMAPLSYTAGLLAEQVWTALALKRAARGEEARYTAAGAWLRALDRTRMFGAARALHEQGLSVFGYGGGNVVVQVPEGGLRHALECVTAAGLLVPAAKVIEAKRSNLGNPVVI